MNFGQGQESGDGGASKLYTGVENFRVTHVCPTHEELKQIYGENAKEDTYILQSQEGHTQAKIVMYLDNEPEEGEDSIKTKLTFFVTKTHKQSQKTGKKLVINIYGKSTWLPLDGSIPENMSWYDTEGVRACYDGEDKLIAFIRNLLNLPGKDKAENPSDAHSQFSDEDWNAIFSGNFTNLKTVIVNSPNKIGLALGVKTTEEGKMYQDVYNRYTLRQWQVGKGDFDNLRKDLIDAQDNGAYPRTYFGDPDFVLREYQGANVAPTNESVLGNTPKPEAATSFFNQ